MPHLLINMLICGEGKKKRKEGKEGVKREKGREKERKIERERAREGEREGEGGRMCKQESSVLSNLYQSGRLFRRTVGSKKNLILPRIMCCECCLGQRKLCVEHVGKVKCQTTHLNYGVQITAVYRVIPTVHTYPHCQDNCSTNNKTRYLEE